MNNWEMEWNVYKIFIDIEEGSFLFFFQLLFLSKVDWDFEKVFLYSWEMKNSKNNVM